MPLHTLNPGAPARDGSLDGQYSQPKLVGQVGRSRMAARREKMMRTCQLRSFGLEHCYFAEIPAPTAGSGEVVVAVRALSLSHRDLAIAKGLHNQNLRLPRTVGNEVAGEVIQVGDGVIGLSVGDRVVNNPIPEWVEGEWR